MWNLSTHKKLVLIIELQQTTIIVSRTLKNNLSYCTIKEYCYCRISTEFTDVVLFILMQLAQYEFTIIIIIRVINQRVPVQSLRKKGVEDIKVKFGVLLEIYLQVSDEDKFVVHVEGIMALLQPGVLELVHCLDLFFDESLVLGFYVHELGCEGSAGAPLDAAVDHTEWTPDDKKEK